MVLVNPGGPGDSGVDEVVGGWQLLSTVVGSNYDIVGWEPRGVGYSIPLANCSGSGVAMKRRSITRHVDFDNDPHRPELPELYFEENYENATAEGEQCQATIGGPNDAGPHMTTSVVVRDMITILDAFAASSYSVGVQEPLNYWGMSYGTFLGQTFSSINPVRVGLMVIDGVVDPEDYVAGLYAKNLQFTDEAFSTFLCVPLLLILSLTSKIRFLLLLT